MGRFSMLAGIKTNQGGLYFEEGDYEVEIDEVKLIRTREGHDSFVISAKVEKSTNPQRAPGCKPSQVIALKEKILETAMGNVKQFAGAVLGILDPDSYLAECDPLIPGDTPEAATQRFWEESLELMVSDEQPCRGVRIHLNCTDIKTRTGGDFTKHVWGPLLG